MIDYSLRFRDQQHAQDVLFHYPAGSPEPVPRYDVVDVIGIIYRPTSQVRETPDGPLPITEPLHGWHANVRHRHAAPELEPYRVEPRAPVRVWA